MIDRTSRRSATALLTFACVFACLLDARPARAQSAVDVQIGKWAVDGPDPTLYSAALWRDIWGPVGWSLRGFGLIDPDSAGRSLFGVGPDLTLLRGNRSDAGLSVYATGGLGLALETGGSADVAALWNAGLGLQLSAASSFGATLEVRRLVQDSGFRGFWNLKDDDRQGWTVSLGFSVRWGGGPAMGPTPPGGSFPANLAPAGDHDRPLANLSAEDGRVLAASVVTTALKAMGEPYRWGGTTTDHGFDCSGLVWYAYRQQGVRIPRVSRDQARSGRPVAAEIGALQPGDILTFSNRPGRVTHVGLYIGDSRFIHASSSGGVRIGNLADPIDTTDRWHVERWVGARRILP